MSLPSNYKQIAVGMLGGSGSGAGNCLGSIIGGSGSGVGGSGGGGSGGGSSRSRSSGGGGGSDRNKDQTPVFTHSNYSNPAFTPQKAGKSSSSKNQAESRAPKPPKPPEKPILPYMRYSKKIWDSVKAQYPDLKLWELGKKIGALWKQLSDVEKQEFVDEYEMDKVEYEKNLKSYHNSPAYQTYLAAKSKLKVDSDIHETSTRGGGSKSQQERRIDIQPAEDEDDMDEGYTYKHVAYARYLRNHRLINEIFSDAVVPDVRSVVTTQRMQVLKRQVSSLTMHQTKLEAELQQMEEKFDAKKQRMIESSLAFQDELKRHCKPAVDEDTFQKMVQRMYEDMKKERQRMEDPSAVMAGNRSNSEMKSSLSGVPSSSPATTSHGASVENKREREQHHSLPPPQPPQSLVAPANNIPSHPSNNKIAMRHEMSSKTDPEPMDIEPPIVKSTASPPTAIPKGVEVPRQATTNEYGKMVKPTTAEMEARGKETLVKGKPGATGKTPTPTPTPTPPPPPPSAVTPNNPGGMVLIEQPLPPTGLPPVQATAPGIIPNHSNAIISTAQTTPPAPLPSHVAPQSQQVPPSMPMHPHPPPPSPHAAHMGPHMAPHQPPPPMGGMPPHGAYAAYGAPPGAPTRSPYYQPQYGPHPAQQSYGQYAPYPHYQQPYGPPPGSHYMNSRPPPQHNGAPPMHYGEHAGPPQPPQQQVVPAQQQQQQAAAAAAASASAGTAHLPPPPSPHEMYGQGGHTPPPSGPPSGPLPHGSIVTQPTSSTVVPASVANPTGSGVCSTPPAVSGGESASVKQHSSKAGNESEEKVE